jgi:hypothetical protein
MYYLGIKIGSQVKHPVIDFDIFTLKLDIFIRNEVRDFDKNLTQLEIRVNRVQDNESQLYFIFFIFQPNEFTIFTWL